MSGERPRSAPLYYVYALTHDTGEQPFTCGTRKLRAITVDGVSAIVERVRVPRDVTEEALREQHALVMRLTRRFEALLPVRFGTVFTSADLHARLEADRKPIRRALDRVRGRVQMTIRIQAASVRSPQLRTSTGTAYLTARRDSERVLKHTAAQLRRAVRPFVEDERIDGGQADLYGTVYHLVRVSDVARYKAAVDAAATALPAVRLTITGPWPVFAFVPELGRSRGGLPESGRLRGSF